MIMDNNLGKLASQFVAERVDIPHPDEVDLWIQLVYAALFSAGFVVWLPTAKARIYVHHVLQQGIAGSDAMASEVRRALNPEQY